MGAERIVNRENPRLLIVDGDADVRSVVEDLLCDRGFWVRQASSCEEAVLVLRVEVFDILLCHLDTLQERDGRLARQVRALEPRPRVVAMSARGREAMPDEADANLAKPFTRMQLLATLRPIRG